MRKRDAFSNEQLPEAPLSSGDSIGGAAAFVLAAP